MALIPHEGLGAPSQKTSLLGGVAQILISPRPSPRLADVGLFVRPKPNKYKEWFTKAGFEDIRLKRIGPKWYRGVRRHGLIMGCSVTGVKRTPGDSPLQLASKVEGMKKPASTAGFLVRFFLGNLGFIYFGLVPLYMFIKDKIAPKGKPI